MLSMFSCAFVKDDLSLSGQKDMEIDLLGKTAARFLFSPLAGPCIPYSMGTEKQGIGRL